MPLSLALMDKAIFLFWDVTSGIVLGR